MTHSRWKIRTDRLLKLAEHLEKGKLGHKKFDFSTTNAGDRDATGCGTNGCAMGELPIVFPEEWHFAPTSCDTMAPTMSNVALTSFFDTYVQVPVFFGISVTDAEYLFFPVGAGTEVDMSESAFLERYGHRRLRRNATRFSVAARIRDFVEKHQEKA